MSNDHRAPLPASHARSTAEQQASRSGTTAQRVREWLGLERNIVIMLATILMLGMGEELWIRYVPKYLEVLGASAWVIGIYGTLKDLLDALYQYPGGWAADKFGRRNSLILFALLSMIGYGLYLMSFSWELVLVGTVFVMAWSSLTLPAIFAIIGDTLPQHRRAIGFSVQSILKRVPIILAPPLGAWLLATLGFSTGMRVGLGITIVLALLGIVIVKRSYIEQRQSVPDTTRIGELWRSMDANLKRLLVADCLARWAEGIPKVFIILYITNVLHGTVVDFGWLTSLQMLTATLIYLPIAKLSDRMNRKPFILLTFAFFALFPLMVVNAQSMWWLTLAFMIAGLREIGEPARKALIVDLAHHALRGRAVGLYYLIRGLVVFPAALVGGWLWTITPQLPFYVAFVVGVLGLLAYAHWGPDAQLEAQTGGVQ